MASLSESEEVGFVPMDSILKKPDKYEHLCTDWVATEKVHGSSFQFFTNDGTYILPASRRRALEKDGSFIRCSIAELMDKYQDHVAKLWHCVHSEDKWAPYRQPADPCTDSDDEGGDDDNDNDDGGAGDAGAGAGATETGEPSAEGAGTANVGDECLVRIYGELYGGGGITKDSKFAAQKEIIYSDEFRFYVFGITVNRRWVTIVELNELCAQAGFPYYAKPMFDPLPSIEALKQFLVDNGVIRSKSSLSEKEGSDYTFMEGVVMTPLTRPDFRFHAVKYLFPSFNDVKEQQRDTGRVRRGNYGTKQRYNSVISKLDIHEREDTAMVIAMFIADIIKESPDKDPTDKQKEIWTKVVTTWLKNDGYVKDDDKLDNIKEGKEKEEDDENKKKKEAEEEEEGGIGMALFD